MSDSKPKAFTAMDEVKGGAFVRSESIFRQWVKADGSTKFAPEKDRYHLYVSYACPWASRCLLVRAFFGLEDVISLSVVGSKMEKTSPDPEDKHHGWHFKTPEEEEGCIPDPIHNFKTIRDLYVHYKDSHGKYTVPILFDKKLDCIVNNESAEIIRMFNKEFKGLATKNKDYDLYPDELVEDIEKANSWVYPQINNGVYRAGFAQKQEPYDSAVNEVFSGLDKAEEVLSKQRYIGGKVFTEADVRLFVTLIRFDEVYVQHFKCLKKRIADYPNLSNYVLDIYQMEGVASSVNMLHIRHHYYRSHPTINKFAIVPIAVGEDLNRPHDRARFDKA
jgi:putative glutathione S-transferase